MPSSGCSALHGMNPNEKKKKIKKETHMFFCKYGELFNKSLFVEHLWLLLLYLLGIVISRNPCKTLPLKCVFFLIFVFAIFKANPIMQGLHQMQM